MLCPYKAAMQFLYCYICALLQYKNCMLWRTLCAINRWHDKGNNSLPSKLWLCTILTLHAILFFFFFWNDNLVVNWNLSLFINAQTIIFNFLFIKALQHKCWRSVGHQVLQPTKDDKLGQYVWKVADRRKNPWYTRTASNLQPFDLCSNAYRNLPGDQDIFSLLFSCIYIHRNLRKWLIIL